MNEAVEKSVVQRKVDDLLNLAATVEVLEGVIEKTTNIYTSTGEVKLYANNEAEARLFVGRLIRKLKAKPDIAKPYSSATVLNATFNYNGVAIVVANYRGKKCAVVVREIVHEAEEEKVIPAKEAWVETVEELVCEMPAVEAEVKAELPAVVEEVPF